MATKHEEEVRKLIRADEDWEPVGPTPMPGPTDLRNWDMRLMKTYKPMYAPFCDLCCFCTYGKCDLTAGKRGACGIDIEAQQARVVLLACCMGMACHGGHAAHIIHYLIEKHSEDMPINLGGDVNVEAPNIRLVMGLKPKTLKDLKTAVEYCEGQLIHMISSLHTGQEGSALDFESKALHISMLDHVMMEAADIAQIIGFKFPTSEPNTALIEAGWGSVDTSKAVILVVGHNPATSSNIIDYLEANGLYDKVEVCGICCTALDTTRYSDKAKIVGPLSRQLFFVRTGIPDVIVTDEQCIRTDITIEAEKIGAALIASSDKACHGLDEVSDKAADDIVKDIVDKGKQVLMLDHIKAGEVASKVALALGPKRKKELMSDEAAKQAAANCKQCGLCERVCPNLCSLGDALKAGGEGNWEPLKVVFAQCIGCGKCEEECPRDIPIFQIMQKAASWDTYNVRAGRGPIMDTEIRNVGAPIVLGTIPGVVAFVGCSNYPDVDDIVEMAEEFARRKYIVVLSGCAAMVAGMKKDAAGTTIYDRYPGDFDAGGVVNVGSCVSNAHITGAAIKIANIFANLPLRANYEVIADYCLNRVGAVGVGWGAMSQKAASIATGCNRLGIPVVLGPHSSKYRRQYLSYKEDDDWNVMDGREQKLVDTMDPSPEHLAYVVETKGKCMVAIAKLCLRRNDTTEGRAIKLTTYIDLHKQYMGGLPDDLDLYIRSERDIPIFGKQEIMEFLKEKGWKEKPTLSLPTLVGTYPSKVTLKDVIGGGR